VSKPSDRPETQAQQAIEPLVPRRHRALAVIGLSTLAIAGTLLAATQGASAGVNSKESVATARGLPPAPASKEATSSAARSNGYRLRCWQYGQLLFDEGPVTMNSEARSAARLVATDRNGAMLYMTDTGGTTCLVRAADPERSPELQK